MIALNSTVWDANDRKLTKEFTRRWEEYESGVGHNHKPISKQERWALREVANNPAITAWRAALTGPEKRKLNHPNNVINRWKARNKTPDGKPSAQAKLKQANIELQEELHQLKKNGDHNGFTKDDSIKDIAVAVIGTSTARPTS